MLYPLSYGGNAAATRPPSQWLRVTLQATCRGGAIGPAGLVEWGHPTADIDAGAGTVRRYAGGVTPEQLSAAIVDVLTALSDEGAITLPDGVPASVTVERPRQKGHGDYATNVALQLAKKAGMNPRDFATLVQRGLEQSRRHRRRSRSPGRASSTSPSRPAPRAWSPRRSSTPGAAYGGSDAFAGEKINLEFVSANPTGPIHIGGVRWAAVGDALGRIFEMTGAEVTREYYFNDHGAQIDRFSRSLLASAKGEPAPEDGYGGAYIDEIASRRRGEDPEVMDLPDEEAQEVFRAEGVEMMFEEIKQSLHDFGVDFDVYFHENNLHNSGAVDRAIARLTEMGNTYEQDGALWLRTEQFGDDKDRVIIKSDGEPAPTSPATSPTTSTSASAASTAASSCSAPTTTATSAG